MPSYFRDSQAVIIVADVTRIDTFKSIPNYLQDCAQCAKKDAIVFIVGNKTDLKRNVSYEEGKALALGYPYFEVSCKNGLNVENVFTMAAQELYAKANIISEDVE